MRRVDGSGCVGSLRHGRIVVPETAPDNASAWVPVSDRRQCLGRSEAPEDSRLIALALP
jgi:hypothetical protein